MKNVSMASILKLSPPVVNICVSKALTCRHFFFLPVGHMSDVSRTLRHPSTMGGTKADEDTMNPRETPWAIQVITNQRLNG